MTALTCPTATKTPLTAADLEAFARDGYCIARGLIDEAALETVRRELAAVIEAKAQDLHRAGTLPDLHSDKPFAQRFGFLMAQTPAIQNGFDIQYLRGPALFDFFHHPALLDAMEQLLGSEISSNPIHHIRAKPPVAQTPQQQKGYFSVPWHQDSGVNVAEADDSDIITTWIPLVDVSEQMGCVQVLPGAHRLGHLAHDAGSGYGTAIKAALMPDIAPVKCVMRSGDVLIMHRHCPHHSTPNRSDQCRWSLDLRWHHTGHNSGRPWQPEFVVRSQSNPAAIMRDHATWDRMWRECLATPGGARVQHRVST